MRDAAVAGAGGRVALLSGVLHLGRAQAVRPAAVRVVGRLHARAGAGHWKWYRGKEGGGEFKGWQNERWQHEEYLIKVE